MTLSSVLLDLIAVIVFASLVIGGYKKGFLKTIVLAAGTLASLLIAFWLSGWLADLIFSNIIRESVIKNISDTLSGLSDATSTVSAISAVLAALPAFVLNPMLAQYGSKEAMVAEIQRNTDNTLSGLSETITDTVVSPVLTMLLQMLLCLLIFIICVIIIKIVAKAPWRSTTDSACRNVKCCAWRRCRRCTGTDCALSGSDLPETFLFRCPVMLLAGLIQE